MAKKAKTTTITFRVREDIKASCIQESIDEECSMADFFNPEAEKIHKKQQRKKKGK